MIQKLTIKEKIGYGFGDFTSSMFWKILSVYLLFYYADVFGISAAVVGTMFLIIRIWDTALDSLVGIISDRTNTKWDRFRPYLLWVAIPFGIVGILTFTSPDLGANGKVIYVYVTSTLMMIVCSTINVPYASLMDSMASNNKENTTLTTSTFIFAFAGSILVLAIIEPLVSLFSKSASGATDLKAVWQLTMIVYALIMVVFFYFKFGWIKVRATGLIFSSSSMTQKLGWTTRRSLNRMDAGCIRLYS